MWKIFTSLGDISKLLTTVIKGITSLVNLFLRKREVKQVAKTTADIVKTVDQANTTKDVSQINKKYGF